MSRKITNNEFIETCKKFHDEYRNKYGLKPYDYSKTKFVKMKGSPIIVTCPYHGDFVIQNACNHSNNHSGCFECGKIISRKKRLLSEEEFFDKCRKVHGTEKYDYSKSTYTGYAEPITYWCNDCKKFVTQNACNHVNGEGCYSCSIRNKNNPNKFTTETYIQRVIEMHPNKTYDFSRTEYIDRNTNVIIGCPKHGFFEVNPGNFVNKSRNSDCPICSAERLKNNSTSKYELEVKQFLQTIIDSGIIMNDRQTLSDNQLNSGKTTELDIYVPKYNKGIEFDGVYWHSDVFKSKNYHVEKTIKCESKGIQLIHIFENEWRNKRKIVESRLCQLFGKTRFKLPARKCYIKCLDIDEERNFFEINHLQGYVNSQICYGLVYKYKKGNEEKEAIVSAMSFGKTRKNLGSDGSCWELYRFANLCEFSIQGGASKLFKHFVNKFKPKKIISYADRRWSSNNEHNLYNQLGFEFTGISEPNYFYVDGLELINRFSLRKDILVSKYGCRENDTEYNFVKNNLGYNRIYDCGTLKYCWLNDNEKTSMK